MTSLKPINQLFEKDPKRRETCRLNIMDGLVFDYSRHAVDTGDMEDFVKQGHAADIDKKMQALLAGDVVNVTEGRAVTHMNYRIGRDTEMERAFLFASKIRREKHYTDIVHVGIGGSHLGPALYYDVIKQPDDAIKVHFLANIDGAEWAAIKGHIDPDKTLYIFVSKSFGTVETLENATTILQDADIKDCVAITSNPKRAKDFGISEDHIFTMPETVGGRFSVWSPVSLSVMIAGGVHHFENFLKGGAAIDSHVKNAPLKENAAFLMAALGDFYRNKHDAQSLVVLPYGAALSHLSGYLQQLDMESNGKSTTLDDARVKGHTGPSVFGQPGTNGQHAFVQWLHQGSDIIPVDFLLFKKTLIGEDNGMSPARLAVHNNWLMANGIAQAEALAFGENNENPHRNFVGNRPSSVIVCDELSPFYLGALIALYEYKIIYQGFLWNINSFDQFGVELGKKIATDFYQQLNGDKEMTHPALFLLK